MAQLPSSCQNIPHQREVVSLKCDQNCIALLRNLKGCNVGFFKSSSRLKGVKKRFVVVCSNSSASFEEVGLAAEIKQENKGVNLKEKKFEYLVNEYGWQVRRMAETEAEMRDVARIQAQAFHEPVVLFNDLFFDFFQAEVLAGLLYRLRNSPPDRYACLVAEPLPGSPGLEQELVGVVDVTVYRDDDVLMHLPGADEYLYVSGIAVLNKIRRRKVATALLKACDVLALLWRFECLALRAYEDDWGARRLYANAGYRVVSEDPPWLTWIGRRRRVLMVKKV